MPFLVNNFAHDTGDRDCAECWKGYPRPCLCGGLIHAQFLSENFKHELQLVYSCDRCQDQYQLKPFPPLRKQSRSRK